MADPPHILHLTTRWLRGGMEAKTLSELRGLRDEVDFTLVHGREFEPEIAEVVDDLGMPRRVLQPLGHYDPLRWPAAARAFADLLDGSDPDILHVHSTEAGIVGRWAARKRDLPVVYTLHGLPFGRGRSLPLRLAVKAAERHLAGHTDRFVANADAIRDAYLEAGIGTRDRYTTIYSGVDLDRLADVEAAPVPGRAPRVLFAGRLAEGKGVRRLVDAVARLVSRGTPAHLLVAGTGPLQGDLDRNPRPWLHVLGFRDDLPAVMRACDLLCLPSDLEGTPRVITEAMASGLPVVATDVGGIPEQVADGESGLLVARGDHEALVEALSRLVRDPDLRRRMGQAGQKRVEAFSVETMLERTEALYRELLAEDG